MTSGANSGEGNKPVDIFGHKILSWWLACLPRHVCGELKEKKKTWSRSRMLRLQPFSLSKRIPTQTLFPASVWTTSRMYWSLRRSI
ncbi:hypothetical protein RvY_18456-4 [Ramazzottius varieornatus]|uniref:Uncharacterized protein n=1 Tax=Ramazzottius varieornatus TaxID=947166 RepID=A0A1D1W5U7_RAMVA|nr:hypothetical protein RvY_18456-4 [Ramazzottius varieornatus]